MSYFNKIKKFISTKAIVLIVIVLSLCVDRSYAQSLNNVIASSKQIVYKNDTIAEITLRPTVVFSRRVDTRKYHKLARNLKIVYPLAKYAHYKLAEIETKMLKLPTKRQRELFLKQEEKALIKEYTPVLKRMTFSQGKLLIKLIDRQTGNTSYSLVKEFRGKFSAFLWQGVARIFGANLKDNYDGKGEDQLIEELIILYEAGML